VKRMGFFEKVKNMFIEEVEEDEPIKKEVIQVKIPKPVVDDEEEDEEEEKEEKIKITKYDDEEEETEKNVISVVPEKKVSVPTYFDDDDFSDLKKDEEEPVKKEIKKEEVKKHEYGQKRYEQPNIVKPNITGYNGKKEEPVKKVFQPTPIISPVYGVLDKNYKKEEITSKKKTETVNTTVNNDTNTVSVDDIRKKAFGTLEDDLEKTLIDKDAIMFTGPSNKKKEKVVKEKKEEVKVKNVVEEKKEEVVEDIGDEIDIFSVLEDEEDMNELEKLLNSYNFEEDNVEEKLNKDYDKYEKELNLDEKLENSDLFNLIDEMYEKKDGE
jgi:hypothetical protein